MTIDLLIHSANQVLTLTGGPQRGASLGRLGLVEAGAVAIDQGRVIEVGSSDDLRRSHNAAHTLDASGKVVMPGFVDPHTHLVWAGDRADEFELRQQGASYMEILAGGGGILATVRKTRAAGLEKLVEEALPRARRMLAHGTTTAEAKSGYGLDWPSEKRMLQAVVRLDEIGPIELVPTFLGAHAVPPEFEARADDYATVIVERMLPDLKTWWEADSPGRPLPFVDAFCEEGAFSVEQTRRILGRARELGFPLKIHADEFKGLGGTALAVELGAVSADHLVQTPNEDLLALASSDTVAVALPCTPFGLNEQAYTPARQILALDGVLALASDLNPGTGWCESMQFVLALACRKMGLTPAQAIAAATINAAAAIARQDLIGSLDPGKQADVLVLDVPDYRHLGYRFGANLVSQVVKRGEFVETWRQRHGSPDSD
jgi:imidazolonepropionase